MAVKIILSISGIFSFFALAYLVVGILIARRILMPPPRSEEMIFEEESGNQKIPHDVLLTPYERVRITGRNKYKLSARIYPAKTPGKKWIMALHGYNNRSLTIAKYAVIFNKLGYNVIAPDMRRSGESGGKTVTFGYFERRDTEDWLEYMYNTYGDISIGLYGISLGAATATLVTSLRNDIRFLISYCSFSSFKDIIISRGPDYLSKIMLLYPSIVAGAYLLSRAVLSNIDIADAAKEVDCPMLIMHSKKDAFTPYWHALKLSEANPRATLHLFEEGAHARAYSVAPEAYERIITEFIQQVEQKQV